MAVTSSQQQQQTKKKTTHNEKSNKIFHTWAVKATTRVVSASTGRVIAQAGNV